MESNDFYSTENLEKQISNRKMSTNKENISWLKTKIIKLGKSKPNSIFYVNHTLLKKSILKKYISKTNRGKKPSIFNNPELKTLYPQGKAISKKKMG